MSLTRTNSQNLMSEYTLIRSHELEVEETIKITQSSNTSDDLSQNKRKLNDDQKDDLPNTSKPQSTIRKKKRSTIKFDEATQIELSKRSLPDYITSDLQIIIVGLCPSFQSAFKGHHYSGPGHHFWKCMYSSGLIPHPMNSTDDYKLPQYGIGLTNVVTKPSKSLSSLTKDEIDEGKRNLIEKIKFYDPKIVLLIGKGLKTFRDYVINGTNNSNNNDISIEEDDLTFPPTVPHHHTSQAKTCLNSDKSNKHNFVNRSKNRSKNRSIVKETKESSQSSIGTLVDINNNNNNSKDTDGKIKCERLYTADANEEDYRDQTETANEKKNEKCLDVVRQPPIVPCCTICIRSNNCKCPFSLLQFQQPQQQLQRGNQLDLSLVDNSIQQSESVDYEMNNFYCLKEENDGKKQPMRDDQNECLVVYEIIQDVNDNSLQEKANGNPMRKMSTKPFQFRRLHFLSDNEYEHEDNSLKTRFLIPASQL